MNGRRYLDREKLRERPYVSICQALGEVEFPNVEQFYTPAKTPYPDSESKETTIRIAQIAGGSYLKIKARKGILTESALVMERFARLKLSYVLFQRWDVTQLNYTKTRRTCSSAPTTSLPAFSKPQDKALHPPVGPLSSYSYA